MREMTFLDYQKDFQKMLDDNPNRQRCSICNGSGRVRGSGIPLFGRDNYYKQCKKCRGKGWVKNIIKQTQKKSR
jgi:DnaJ-class molecular chaperone